jgi:hypothetical protein
MVGKLTEISVSSIKLLGALHLAVRFQLYFSFICFNIWFKLCHVACN